MFNIFKDRGYVIHFRKNQKGMWRIVSICNITRMFKKSYCIFGESMLYEKDDVIFNNTRSEQNWYMTIKVDELELKNDVYQIDRTMLKTMPSIVSKLRKLIKQHNDNYEPTIEKY